MRIAPYSFGICTAVLTAVVFSSSPALAVSKGSVPLPDSTYLSALKGVLWMVVDETVLLIDCPGAAQESCDLNIEGEEHHIAVEDYRKSAPEAATAKTIHINSRHRDGKSLSLEAVEIEIASADQIEMRADVFRWTKPNSQMEGAQFRWEINTFGADGPSPGVIRLRDIKWAPPSELRAHSLFYDGDWHAEQLRSGGLPVAEHRGALAPTLSFNAEGFRLRGDYLVSENTLGVMAAVEDREAIGLGLTVNSNRGEGPAEVMDLAAWMGREGDLDASLQGRLSLGSPQHQLSADLDGIALGHIMAPRPALRRGRISKWASPYSLEQAGASTQGDDFALGLGATAATEESWTLRDGRANEGRLWAQSAFRVPLGAGLLAQWQMRWDARELSGESGGRRGDQSLWVERYFGSTQSIYLRPALSYYQSIGDPVEGAESPADLAVGVETGAAFEGLWGSWRHAIRPRLMATQSAGDIIHGQSRGDRRGALSAQILQRWMTSGGRALSIPLDSVWVRSPEGDHQHLSRAAIQWHSGGVHSSFRLALEARCINGCGDDAGFKAHLVAAPGFGSRFVASWTSHPAAFGREMERYFGGTLHRALAPEATLAGTMKGTDPMWLVGARKDWQRWGVEWLNSGSRNEGRIDYGAASIYRYFSDLGWGVGLSGGADLRREIWQVFIGLRNGRVF